MLGHLVQKLQSIAAFEDVIVTSGDEAVLEIAARFGATAARTSGAFRNGSQRVAAAVESLGLSAETILNIQGDMPGVEVQGVSELIRVLKASSLECWTLSRRCKNTSERADPNRVKVVVDSELRACYFSRSAIPFGVDVSSTRIHIGVYGFQPGQLMRYVGSPMSDISVAEDLEQLDWLAAGHRIGVHQCEWSVPSVDQPSDVAGLEAWLARKQTPN